jgi:hypothetical protein
VRLRLRRAAIQAKALPLTKLANSAERKSITATGNGGKDVDVGYRDPLGSAGAMDGRVLLCNRLSERTLA